MARRNRKGAKSLDVAALRDLLSKMPMVTSFGVVRKFPGEDSHFEISTNDGSREILVDVEMMPNGERALCRLGFGGDGIYRIPRVNSEVAIIVPMDPASLIKDNFDCDGIIVGVLDIDAPSQLNGDDIVVVQATRVHVLSADIKLGTNPNPLDGAVVGTGIDPFSGATYTALGNTSQKVKVEK